MKHSINYFFLRTLLFPFSLLPYSALHFLGKFLGTCAYYLMTAFRKRALSNIALSAVAKEPAAIRKIAIESFQNLMTTCLEYPKFDREKNISRIARCHNPDEAQAIMNQGKGVIFFCGHQANWEVLFLEGTSRMPGVAIGRPIKNKLLYEWILSIREKYGGKIIPPRNAIKEGLRALRNGAFLGIVGDQGMPDSGYSSPFFGVSAWTSTIPAILSYRTGVPIIVATTLRQKNSYIIDYSPPIWPNPEEPMEKEIDRMMRLSLLLLEESIRKYPGQWMWQHNRWKQQTLANVKKRFRQDTICILLPEKKENFEALLPHLPTFRKIYPHEFITVLVPASFANKTFITNATTVPYKKDNEMLLNDMRFKLVFNFSENTKVRKHYLNLAAFEVICLNGLKKLAPSAHDFSDLLTKALTHAR